MGMFAEIIAIGPYSPDIKAYLEYPDERYEKTQIGIPVVRVLFGIGEGSTVSRQFASLLGISDPWDFNQHKLNPSTFDIDGLKEFFTVYEDYDEDLEALLAFSEKGFEFYFMPNG
jgi:hypothetical protein